MPDLLYEIRVAAGVIGDHLIIISVAAPFHQILEDALHGIALAFGGH